MLHIPICKKYVEIRFSCYETLCYVALKCYFLFFSNIYKIWKEHPHAHWNHWSHCTFKDKISSYMYSYIIVSSLTVLSDLWFSKGKFYVRRNEVAIFHSGRLHKWTIYWQSSCRLPVGGRFLGFIEAIYCQRNEYLWNLFHH